MNPPRQVRYGSLDCYVIDPPGDDQTPRRGLVMLCHGYGAPGSDMVGIVAEWLHLLGDSAGAFRFVCPIAPHGLQELGLMDGRAWWPLNMSLLMEKVQANRFAELHDEVPPGIDGARETLSEAINGLLDELAAESGQSPSEIPLAIGGFSQGAMLTMDTAARGEIPTPDVLFQFSGTVVCRPLWEAALPQRLAKTQVYQSHGSFDPVLPFSSAEALRDLFTAADVDIEFHAFAGPHTIAMESISSTAVMLNTLLQGASS